MTITQRSSVEHMAVSFARVLRGAGLSVPLDSVLTFIAALDLTSITDRDAVYWSARATLIRRPEDRPLFDRAFAVFWEQRAANDSPEDDATTSSVTLLVDDVTAATFRTMDFVSLAERHGCVGLTLSRMLMARLRSTTERIYQRTTLSSFGRVYAELLRMAKMGDGRLIQPVPIFSELAGRVHTTRETVSRAISALERRGLINREGGAMTILAPQRLEELVV